MNKIVLNDIVTTNTVAGTNENMSKIESHLNDRVLYRESIPGTENQMHTNLDMNSNRIYNLPKPLSSTEPVRLKDLIDLNVSGPSPIDVPADLVTFRPYAPIVDENVQDALESVIDLVTARSSNENLRIVVLGDSVSAKNSGLDMAWPQMLQQQLTGNGIPSEVIGVAVNGATHYSAMTDPQYDGDTQVQRCIALTPDIVIVALGINDGYRSTVVGIPQAQAEALAVYTALRAGLPTAKIVSAQASFYDTYHGTPATLRNEQVYPVFMVRPTSGLLSGLACPEMLNTAADSGVRLAASGVDGVLEYVKTLPSVDSWFKLPVWEMLRLGLGQTDGIHPSFIGSRFLTSAVYEGILQHIPAAGSQPMLPESNSWTSLWSDSLVNTGVRFVPKAPASTISASPRSYWGTAIGQYSDTWYLPSRGRVLSHVPLGLYLRGNSIFGANIKGALPNSPVYYSANNGAWQPLGTTDSIGDFVHTLDLSSIVAEASTTTLWRHRVGNEAFPQISLNVSGTGWAKADGTNASGLWPNISINAAQVIGGGGGGGSAAPTFDCAFGPVTGKSCVLIRSGGNSGVAIAGTNRIIPNTGVTYTVIGSGLVGVYARWSGTAVEVYETTGTPVWNTTYACYVDPADPTNSTLVAWVHGSTLSLYGALGVRSIYHPIQSVLDQRPATSNQTVFWNSTQSTRYTWPAVPCTPGDMLDLSYNFQIMNQVLDARTGCLVFADQSFNYLGGASRATSPNNVHWINLRGEYLKTYSTFGGEQYQLLWEGAPGQTGTALIVNTDPVMGEWQSRATTTRRFAQL